MSRTLTMMSPGEPHALRTRLRFLALKRASRSRPGSMASSGRPGLTMQDARDFLMAYCACFLAVSAFIA